MTLQTFLKPYKEAQAEALRTCDCKAYHQALKATRIATTSFLRGELNQRKEAYKASLKQLALELNAPKLQFRNQFKVINGGRHA